MVDCASESQQAAMLEEQAVQLEEQNDEAKKVAGCVPLYMFYHPNSALEPAAGGLPAVARFGGRHATGGVDG